MRKTGQSWLERIVGILTVLTAFIWLVLLVDHVIMPMITLAGVEREVPDMHHLDFERADSICNSLGLQLIKGRTRIEDKQNPGTILDQFPVAGAIVKPGRRIEVVISAQAGLSICPNMIGRSPREAAIMAHSAGLYVNPEKMRYWHSSSFPEGVVMRQSPQSGTEMNRGVELILTVSLGEKPEEIFAPDLVGRKGDAIGVILAKNSLRRGNIVRFPDRSSPSGTVLSQDPPAGTPMKPGGRVSVRIAVTPVPGSITESPGSETP